MRINWTPEQQSIHYHIYLHALFGYYTLPRLSGLHLRTQDIDSCKGQSELNLDGGILSLPADDIGLDYFNNNGSAGSTKINIQKVGGWPVGLLNSGDNLLNSRPHLEGSLCGSESIQPSTARSHYPRWLTTSGACRRWQRKNQRHYA
tara:strand:+ start:146 stop:586 length:441 start_codon:yes stop_codon:yes gene_type:complete